MIPYGRQDVSEEDIQAVIDVLKSDFLTQGPVVPAFEEAVIGLTGAAYAVAVNSGTSALHLACIAVGLGEGDWLWTTPITFVASANCALYCGANVDFVDIDPVDWNISVDRLREKLESARKQGCLPKVVVPVHLGGLPCDMEQIHALSQEYGFSIIEDACHAIGGRYQGNAVGDCRYSDVTVFSFHPVKTVTTGEGGMAVTNNKELANRMALLRSHGITRNPALMTHEPDGPWYYQQVDLGFNYRLTDLQAALGISQLRRLDDFVFTRNKVAEKYYELLSGLPLQLPHRQKDKYSGMHLYICRLIEGESRVSHGELVKALREEGVGVNLHYIPIFTQPYYQQLQRPRGEFPEAEKYYREAFSIPMYPGITKEEQLHVIGVLRSLL
jgi:UDP-4-amino-4,6-dideoxy-N-acetyl-beta-L-altrosamine transaminase